MDFNSPIVTKPKKSKVFHIKLWKTIIFEKVTSFSYIKIQRQKGTFELASSSQLLKTLTVFTKCPSSLLQVFHFREKIETIVAVVIRKKSQYTVIECDKHCFSPRKASSSYGYAIKRLKK